MAGCILIESPWLQLRQRRKHQVFQIYAANGWRGYALIYLTVHQCQSFSPGSVSCFLFFSVGVSAKSVEWRKQKNPREKDAEVIAKLEEVIASLKSAQIKDE